MASVVMFNGQALSVNHVHFRILKDNAEFYTLRENVQDYMQYFEESNYKKTDRTYGPMKFYHIHVGNRTLADGAWYFTDDSKAGDLRGHIGFRVDRLGDPGNPWDDTYKRKEGNGVTISMDFFG